MNMAKVTDCDMGECAYNRNQECHALAITIGNEGEPRCDTFVKCEQQGGDALATAGVGACKTSECRYNADLECCAPSIQVAHTQGHPDCKTFEAG